MAFVTRPWGSTRQPFRRPMTPGTALKVRLSNADRSTPVLLVFVGSLVHKSGKIGLCYAILNRRSLPNPNLYRASAL